MSSTPVTALRRAVLSVLVVALGLGATACSSGDATAEEPKPSHSASAEPEPDWDELAEKALVTTKLPALAGYEAGEVEKLPSDEVPFEECVDEVPDAVEPEAAASRDFALADEKTTADLAANVYALGAAVDGSAVKAFEDLREIWKSKKCDSYNSDIDAKLKRGKAIDPPKGVDEDAWYGICHEPMTQTGDPGEFVPMSVGTCRVIYVSGEHTMTQLQVEYFVSAVAWDGNTMEIDLDGGVDDARETVATIAHEALVIK